MFTFLIIQSKPSEIRYWKHSFGSDVMIHDSDGNVNVDEMFVAPTAVKMLT